MANEKSLTHRVWQNGTLVLMLLITIQLVFSGFFKSKTLVLDRAPLLPEHAAPGRKVIYLLFDALREDFVKWPGDRQPTLNLTASYAYKGKKLDLFRDTVENEPEYSVLLPQKSEMPTITAVRIKTFLSGCISTVFDATEALTRGAFQEDNLLAQLHAKLADKARIFFFGEDIWTQNFGAWFTKEVSWPDPDVRQLDVNDAKVKALVVDELKAGSHFDMMVLHMVGVDHAGHTYEANHPELERKLLETEEFVREVMELMDRDTTLVVFGDHGMTESGSHGDNSLLELSTVLFAFQKRPFPLAQKYHQFRKEFAEIDRAFKQADIAPIGSLLLNVPFPFSNIGLAHPIFTQSADLAAAVDTVRANLEQIYTYVEASCALTYLHWCDQELADFKRDLDAFDRVKPSSERDQVQRLQQMSQLANAKYEHLKRLWVGHDTIYMQLGIVMGVNLFFFHQYVNFSRSQFQQDVGGLVGLSLSATVYAGSLLGLYGCWVAAFVCFLVSNGQTWRQRNSYWRLVYSKVVRRENYTPKALVYPSLTGAFLLGWLVFNCSVHLQEVEDYVVDALVLLALFCMWVTQPSHLRHRDVKSALVIVLCLKLSYFNDNE